MRIGLGIGIPQFQGNGPSGIASSINFAQLVTGDVPSGWTFTRSTAGTYFDASGVLQTAATNVLRISRDPVSGELGYLAEPGRTNLLTYSEQFDNASWTKGAGASVSANTVTAPDGTLTGDSLVASGSPGSVYQTAVGLTPATIYTASAYVKYSSVQWVRFMYYDGGGNQCRVWVDVQNGVIGTGNAAGTGTFTAATIVPAGSGWYRISVTGTQPAVNGLVQFQPVTADASTTPAAGTVYMWGAQLEAGSYPTSYIPTTTVAVSRGADLLTTTLSAAHAAALSVAGTMVARFSFLGGGSAVDPGVRIICAVDDGTATNRNIIYNSAAGYVAGLCGESGGSSAGPVVSSSKPTNTPVKAAIGWGLNDVNIGVDGSLGIKDASFTPGTVTKLAVGGASYTGFFGPSCLIHSLAVHTSRLTDAQLQALTA